MKRRSGIRDEPARNGAIARTSPTKRPIRIALPPWRSKKSSTCSSRSCGDLHLRSVALEEPAAEPPAQVVAREVARDRAGPDDRDQRDDVDPPLAGDDAADEDRELARRDEADERAGLEERQRADEQVRPLAEALADVLDQLSRLGGCTRPVP